MHLCRGNSPRSLDQLHLTIGLFVFGSPHERIYENQRLLSPCYDYYQTPKLLLLPRRLFTGSDWLKSLKFESSRHPLFYSSVGLATASREPPKENHQSEGANQRDTGVVPLRSKPGVAQHKHYGFASPLRRVEKTGRQDIACKSGGEVVSYPLFYSNQVVFLKPTATQQVSFDFQGIRFMAYLLNGSKTPSQALQWYRSSSPQESELSQLPLLMKIGGSDIKSKPSIEIGD